MYIFITGNPVDGFEYNGPFECYDDAFKYGEENGDSDWWIAPLAPITQN